MTVKGAFTGRIQETVSKAITSEAETVDQWTFDLPVVFETWIAAEGYSLTEKFVYLQETSEIVTLS